MLKTMQTEVDRKVKHIVKSTLNVPELIGKDCPFSSYKNFMANFHEQTQASFKMLKYDILSSSHIVADAS